MGAKEEWEDWLSSPAEVTKTGFRVVGPPPPWFWKAIVLVRLEQNRGYTSALDRLVKWGCDRDRLISHLESLLTSPAADSWERMTGFGPKEMKAAVNRLNRAADDVEKINTAFVSRALLKRQPLFQKYQDIPTLLRSFARFWSTFQPFLKRRKIHTSAAKHELIQYVMLKTGQPHDSEVSELISAVLGNDQGYDAVALRMWRGSHGLVTRNRGLTQNTNRPQIVNRTNQK